MSLSDGGLPGEERSRGRAGSGPCRARLLCMRKRVLERNGALILISLLAVGLGWSLLAEAKARRSHRRSAPAATAAADCKVDRDCALVVDDCCPCSQGGKQRSVPKKGKDAYEKARKKRCAGTMCTEMMSEDPSCSQVPFCGAGICELGAAP